MYNPPFALILQFLLSLVLLCQQLILVLPRLLQQRQLGADVQVGPDRLELVLATLKTFPANHEQILNYFNAALIHTQNKAII